MNSQFHSDISEETLTACFDVENTLVSCHALQLLYWLKTRYYGGLAALYWRCWFIALLPVFGLLYLLSRDRFDQFIYAGYKGLREDKLLLVFQHQVLPLMWCHLYPQADTLLRRYRSEGTDIHLVGNMWSPLLACFGQFIGAKSTTGTQLEVSDGRLTGKVIRRVNVGSKAALLQRLQSQDYGKTPRFAVYSQRLEQPLPGIDASYFIVNAKRRKPLHLAEKLHWRHPKTHWTIRFFSAVLRPFYRSINGWHHLPKEGGCIVIANHASHLDQYVLYPLFGLFTRRRLKYLAKKEHFSSPLFARVIDYMGAVPVDRARGGKAALLKAIELVNAGHAVVIFPEGTRSRTGAMNTFKSGVVLIQEKTGAPIVPVAIAGTFEAWPYNKKYPVKGEIDLRVGAMIDSLCHESTNGPATKAEKSAMLQAVVAGLLPPCV